MLVITIFVLISGNSVSYSQKSAVDSTAIDAICKRYYGEICMSKLTSPDPIVNEQGYYVLDLSTHKSDLQKTGLFSTHFIASLDSVFSECVQALEQEKLTEEQVWEGGIDMNAPSGCGFFNYNYHFQSQEDPEGFFISNMVIDVDRAIAVIHYFSGNYSWDNHVYLKIGLKKQDQSWYIDAVEKVRPQGK